jgi:hypothetical protein
MHVISPVNLVLRDLITLTIISEEYKLWSSSSYAACQDFISQRKYAPVLLKWNHMKTNQDLEVNVLPIFCIKGENID